MGPGAGGVGRADAVADAVVVEGFVGLVRVGVGLAGAGPIAYLMSQPVVASFTSAAALLIMATQVPALTDQVHADGSRIAARRSGADG